MRRLFFFSTLILFSLSSLFAQFEGEVVMNLAGDGTESITFVVKGTQVRMQPQSDEPVTMYLDGATQTFTVLTEQNGKTSAIEFSLDSDSPIGALMNSEEVNEQVTARGEYGGCTFEETGKSESLNGNRCTIWKGSCPEGEQVELWMAEELGLSFAQLFPVNGPGTDRLLQKAQIFGVEGFPLKIKSTDSKGKVSVIENQVTPRSVSTSEVSLPEDIEAYNMNDLMLRMVEAIGDAEKMQQLQEQLEVIRQLNEH